MSIHPQVAHVLKFFDCEDADPAAPFRDLAHDIAARLSGPEVTIALRHLLAARDAALRAVLA